MNGVELVFLSSLAVIIIAIVYAYISEFNVGVEKDRLKTKRR